MNPRPEAAALNSTTLPKNSGAPPQGPVGVGMHSYGAFWKAARQNHPQARFHDALAFLEYGRQLGAAGVQVALGTTQTAELQRLKTRAAETGLYLEAQTSLPAADTASDWDRFEADVLASRTAGSPVLRTALLPGRRYETFSDPETFRQFAARAEEILRRAEPILRRHRIVLAVENHKDLRAPELLGLLERLGSEWIRVTLDTGNSIALLEDPMEVVKALAPFAATTHLKDMAVAEVEDGFLLSEVPLGEGFLDLQQIIDICQKASPGIRFNLEMITRDPLRIPCLTPPYWAALETLPASDLARSIKMVRSHPREKPLPRVQNLSFEALLALEDANVRQSLAHASSRIRFSQSQKTRRP